MRNGVVVAPHHLYVVAVGADQGHARIGRQGQHGIPVLQEHERFAGHAARQGQMFGTLHHLFRKVIPRRFPVHFAQAEPGGEQAEKGAVDMGLVFVAAGHRFGQMLEMVAAFQVDSVIDGVGNGGQRVFGPMVVGIEVFDAVAVGGNDAFKTPFLAQQGIYQVIIDGAGLAPEGVVGGHYFLDIGLGDQVLEGGEVCFVKVTFRAGGVEGMTQGFRSRMYRKMLGTGVGLQHLVAGVSLQAADHGHTQPAGQVRVFPIGLHAASPARVAEQVDVGRPEGKPLVDVRVSFHFGQAVLDARLIAHGSKDLIDKRFIERCRHPDGLREHCRTAVAGHPVQGLVPPVVSVDAQARNGYRPVLHQRALLFEGQPAQQVGGAFFGRETFVQIRGPFVNRPARNGCRQGKQEYELIIQFHGDVFSFSKDKEDS